MKLPGLLWVESDAVSKGAFFESGFSVLMLDGNSKAENQFGVRYPVPIDCACAEAAKLVARMRRPCTGCVLRYAMTFYLLPHSVKIVRHSSVLICTPALRHGIIMSLWHSLPFVSL